MSQNRIIIGIAGASGSGKSLLSNTIVDELGSDKVVVISEDSYYQDLSHLTLEERGQVNFDHPDSLDHDLFIQHMEAIKNGEAINIPTYDFSQHNRTDEATYIDTNHSIFVIEGILLFTDPVLRGYFDMRVYVDAAADICFIRRLQRDVHERGRDIDSVIAQYEKTVRPMFFQFVEPSKRYADIIIPHGGKNRIAIEVIQAKIKEML